MSLKNPKKVHESDEFAIFKDASGHELKVSKKGLSEKLRKELAALPLHAAEGDYVKGSNEEDYKSLPDQQPPQEGLMAQAPSLATTEQPMPQEVPPQQSQPTDTPTQQAPVSPEVPAQPAPQQPAPQPSPGEFFVNEMNHYFNDAASGNIKAKTHSDLLFKDSDGKDKGFVGKLGALFGLMLSGAGSGLSGQPNAVMQMMDNEIKNDLEAQKSNKTNELTYGKLLDNHIQTMAASSKIQSDIWHLALQDHVTADIMKQSYARREQLAKFYKDQVSAYPEGTPQRKKAEDVFAAMVNAANKEDVGAGELINGRAALYGFDKVSGIPGATQNKPKQDGGQSQVSPMDKGPVNLDRISDLQRKAELKIPSIPGRPIPNESDLAAMKSEAQRLGDANMLRKEYLHIFDEIVKMPRMERAVFNSRVKALMEPFLARATKVSEGRFTDAANKAWKNILPAILETPKTTKIKREEGARLFDLAAGSAPTLERYDALNKRQPEKAPAPKGSEKKSEKHPPDGTPVTTNSGRKAKWMGGKMVYVE